MFESKGERAKRRVKLKIVERMFLGSWYKWDSENRQIDWFWKKKKRKLPFPYLLASGSHEQNQRALEKSLQAWAWLCPSCNLHHSLHLPYNWIGTERETQVRKGNGAPEIGSLKEYTGPWHLKPLIPSVDAVRQSKARSVTSLYLELDVKYMFEYQGIKWLVMVEKVSHRKFYSETSQLELLPIATYHKLFL